MSKLSISWTRSPDSDGVLKYEIRRIDNPGTTVSWGDGVKIGETTTNTFETTAFPYDTNFAIMISAWDGYKWSTIDEYWTGTIDRPVTVGDITTEAGSDEDGSSFPGTGTGWTLTTAGYLTTQQDTLDSAGTLDTAFSTGLNGSGKSGNTNKVDLYEYITNEKDIGFATEVEFRPIYTSLSSFDMTLDQWNWPLGVSPTRPFYNFTRSNQFLDYIQATPGTEGAPPLSNITLDGTPQNGQPLTIDIAYSENSTVGTPVWIPLPYGKKLKLRSYKFRFRWRPYYPNWHFTFLTLKIKVFRPNRKLIIHKTGLSTWPESIDFNDPDGNPYKFFQKPTVQLTSTDPGISYDIGAYVTDGNGLYTGVTVNGYDITTGAPYAGSSGCTVWIDGF